jgi:hypothetical protein
MHVQGTEPPLSSLSRQRRAENVLDVQHDVEPGSRKLCVFVVVQQAATWHFYFFPYWYKKEDVLSTKIYFTLD